MSSVESQIGKGKGGGNFGQTGELGLIARIRDRAGGSAGRIGGASLRLGIGDDCALLRPRRGEELAITTDLSIAGRHFRLDWHPPESVGHRTLARGLSDLAAMGARPVAAFLSLGLPKELVGGGRPRPAWADRFLNGFFALAGVYQTPLAGGDLAESPVAVADIVLIGALPQGRGLLRSGARAGDSIYVTGSLGGAEAGLAALQELAGTTLTTSKPAQANGLRIPANLASSLAPHLYPQPRIAQGHWLARRGLATAALDISDGLSIDLMRLCQESGVSAEIDANALPLSAGATQAQALHGGEDYELLFTAAPSTRLPRSIAGVPVTRIGQMLRNRTGRPRMVLITPRGRETLDARGWEHFSA